MKTGIIISHSVICFNSTRHVLILITYCKPKIKHASIGNPNTVKADFNLKRLKVK